MSDGVELWALVSADERGERVVTINHEVFGRTAAIFISEVEAGKARFSSDAPERYRVVPVEVIKRI